MSAHGRILLVDDDREILEMTELLLAKQGYEVLVASSGEEALDMAQDSLPHLILLDINMPGMDGWEVLRLLREDESTRDLPVMMFSVQYEVRDKLHAMQQGAQDYVTKPFDTERLIAKVRQVVPAITGGSQ